MSCSMRMDDLDAFDCDIWRFYVVDFKKENYY